ncbi:MAG: translation initiation factor IF-2 [Planctomycetia bacterium]|nr:translation initiation factor IF-2 [Planctomycetia bacterium]
MPRQIWKLAKELNRASYDLIEAAYELGFIEIKNSFSSLKDEQVEKVLEYIDSGEFKPSSKPKSGVKRSSAKKTSKTSTPSKEDATVKPGKDGGAVKVAKPVSKEPTRVVKKPAAPEARQVSLNTPVGIMPTLAPPSGLLKTLPGLPTLPQAKPQPAAVAPQAPQVVSTPVTTATPEPVVKPVLAPELPPTVAEPKVVEKPETNPVDSEPGAAEPQVATPVQEFEPAKEQSEPIKVEPAVEKVDAPEKIDTPVVAKVEEPKVPESTKTAEPVQMESKPSVDLPSAKRETAPATATTANVPSSTIPLRNRVDGRGGSAQSRDARASDGKGDSKSRGRDRDRNGDSRRTPAKPAPEPRPVRPVMPVSGFMAQLTGRAEALSEMKRPPVITTPSANDRIRVLGQPRRVTEDKTNGEQTSRSGQSSSKSKVTIRVAPVPTTAVKVTKVATPQAPTLKPISRGPVDAFQTPLIGRVQGMRNDSSAKTGSGKQSTVATAGRSQESRGGKRGAHDMIDDGEFGSYGKDSGKKSRGRRDENARDAGRGGNASRRPGNNKGRYSSDDDEGGRYVSRSVGRNSSRREKNSSSVVTAPRKGDLVIQMPCTVRQFAELTGVPVNTVILKLMSLGTLMTQNQSLDADMIELLIMELDLKATVKKEVTLEEQYVDPAFDEEDDPDSLVPRAPVVAFLGHVDHGKTSLLDKILKLHVAAGEKGGITQHIRAYRVDTPRGAVTFVDTPGHEAFTEMRARGANCTDIVVLVVAADDGVMPQTEEAISHAKAAGVPIVVALNKMDLPGVSRDRVIQELAQNDVMPSEWGGDVEVVETSALTGAGVDDLLDTLLTVAELNDLKANPNRRAVGVTLEASLQQGQGVVCKALVQNGTLHTGDVVLCGSSYGRVRSMTDTLDEHKRIKAAGPSVPITLTGLDVAPEAGSKFVVLDDIAVAREIATERAARRREIELAGSQGHVTLESLRERLNQSQTQQVLNVIIRADVRGSIEAIRKELGKLEHPEVKVKILQATVGGITEADVHLADASDAIIVGFNVVPDEGARNLAESKKVQIRRYDVIYKLTDDIRAALEGMLKPLEQVKELGRARVQRTFNISHVGVIAGCRVISGVIERDCNIRVIRDSRIIGDYPLETLKRERDEAREVRDGYECGMKLKNYNDVKEGDILEAYKIEEVARTFD